MRTSRWSSSRNTRIMGPSVAVAWRPSRTTLGVRRAQDYRDTPRPIVGKFAPRGRARRTRAMLRDNGEMAERFKAPVLKTGDGQPSVGSNPTLSATHETAPARGLFRVWRREDHDEMPGSTVRQDCRHAD